MCFYVWVLVEVELFDEWNMICANNDYLRFIYGRKFRGF